MDNSDNINTPGQSDPIIIRELPSLEEFNSLYELFKETFPSFNPYLKETQAMIIQNSHPIFEFVVRTSKYGSKEVCVIDRKSRIGFVTIRPSISNDPFGLLSSYPGEFYSITPGVEPT